MPAQSFLPEALPRLLTLGETGRLPQTPTRETAGARAVVRGVEGRCVTASRTTRLRSGCGAGSELPSGGACAPPHVGGDGTSPPNPHPGTAGARAVVRGVEGRCVTASRTTRLRSGCGAGSELLPEALPRLLTLGDGGLPQPPPGDRRREGGGAGCGGSVRDCVTHDTASKEGGAGSELPSGGACAPPHVGGDGTSPPNPHPGDRRREGGGAGCGGSVRDCVTHDTASKEGGAGSELPSGGACAPPHVGGAGVCPEVGRVLWRPRGRMGPGSTGQGKARRLKWPR